MRKTTDRWGRHQEAPRLPLTEDVLLGRETLLEVFQVVLPLERLERIAVVDPRAHRPKHERQAAREAPRVVLPARLGVGVGAAAGGVSAAAVGCRQWDADSGDSPEAELDGVDRRLDGALGEALGRQALQLAHHQLLHLASVLRLDALKPARTWFQDVF